MKSIVIELDDKTGELLVKGQGFKGKECDKALAKITDELGTVTKRTNLPEYYQQVGTTQKVGK